MIPLDEWIYQKKYYADSVRKKTQRGIFCANAQTEIFPHIGEEKPTAKS